MKQTPIKRNINLIFNWIFITGIIVLAVNDHYLKQHHPSWLTGKLSDFAGLLIFPMFLQFLFPKLDKWAVIITGIFFVFFKSPLADGLLSLYNHIALIPLGRVIDYSDYIALSLLPVSWYLIDRIDRFGIKASFPVFLRYAALPPIVLIFIATAPSINQSMPWGGDIHIGKYYRLKISKDEALTKLKAKGYNVEPDTARYLRTAEGYVIHNLVLDGGKDTLKSLQLAFMPANKTCFLLINNVTLKPADKLKDLKLLKRAYRQLIKTDFVEELN